MIWGDLTLQPANCHADTAYMDGSHAGSRTGPYTGFKTEPMCPYPPGSQDHADWYAGLSDAVDDLQVREAKKPEGHSCAERSC